MSSSREPRRLSASLLWTPLDAPVALEREQLTRVRIVAAVTLVAGAFMLWLSLHIPAGDPMFYPATLGLAAVWVAGGLVGSRPHLGWAHTRSGRRTRPVLLGLAVGAALVVVFVLGALVVARIPVLRAPVDALLDHARFGSLAVVFAVTMINGVAEETFFRGTLYDALPYSWAIPGTVVVYGAVTAASGVPLLVLAGVLLGIVTALERRVTGGLLAAIITHLTWSGSMLFLLPPVLDRFG